MARLLLRLGRVASLQKSGGLTEELPIIMSANYFNLRGWG